MKTTPTTKILAIGTINPGFEQSQVFAVLPEEVRETVDLYLDGKIEQWRPPPPDPSHARVGSKRRPRPDRIALGLVRGLIRTSRKKNGCGWVSRRRLFAFLSGLRIMTT